MTPSQLYTDLMHAVRIKEPYMIWGPPGGGKSSLVQQVSDALNMSMADVRALLLDPVDLRGLPSVSKGVTSWNIPSFLPTEGDGVLFLDELPAAPPMTQAALYQLVLDRRIGDYFLPEGWAIVAAGNREEDGAVSHRMPSALRDRFIHGELVSDISDWSEWALPNQIEPVVIAFLRSRPELLHRFNKKDRSNPTPRSWARVSRILASGTGNQASEHRLIMGTVGEGAATEFSAYLRLFRDLPSADEILMNPKGAIVPKNAATLYAIASGVARFVTVTNIARAIQYFDRLPQEYAVLGIQDAIKRDNGLTHASEYRAWIIAHSDVLR